MDNAVLESVYAQVHKEITTAMQTGEFWTMWDNDVYQEALLTIYASMNKWQERTIIGEA